MSVIYARTKKNRNCDREYVNVIQELYPSSPSCNHFYVCISMEKETFVQEEIRGFWKLSFVATLYFLVDWVLQRWERFIICMKVNKVSVRPLAITSGRQSDRLLLSRLKIAREDNLYWPYLAPRYIVRGPVFVTLRPACRAGPQMTHAKVNYTLKGFNIMKCSICMSSRPDALLTTGPRVSLRFPVA